MKYRWSFLMGVMCFQFAAAQVDSLRNIDHQQLEEIFKLINFRQQFPGCENLPRAERDTCANRKLHDYLQNKISFPEELKVGGRVIAHFRVEKDGGIEEVSIIKSLCKQCDNEVIDVLKNMPKWTPANARGRPMRLKYQVTVLFNPI